MSSNEISTIVLETSGGRNLSAALPSELAVLILQPRHVDDLYETFNITRVAERLRVVGRDPMHSYGMGWARWHRNKRLRAEFGLPVLDIPEAHLVAMERLGYQINISTGEVRYANDNA